MLFPTLSALAARMIFGNMKESGLEAEIKAQCLPGSQYYIEFSGVKVLDENICSLVAMFHAALTPSVYSFLVYFSATCGPPVVAFIGIEACRKRSHFSLTYPIIFGISFQLATYGVTLPIYWLLFILTGASRPSKNADTKIARGDAGAIIFNLWMGWGIPTVAMLVLQDPWITALWQAVPLWASVAQRIHLTLQPSSKSGYGFVKGLYIFCFLLASSLHLATVYPILHDVEALKAFFVPSVAALNQSTPIELLVRDLLQWDMNIAMASSILATLWFARSFTQLVGVVVWNAVAIPVVGPGAAFAGVALWRESTLNANFKSTSK